jgi:hypothetical protein
MQETYFPQRNENYSNSIKHTPMLPYCISQLHELHQAQLHELHQAMRI